MNQRTSPTIARMPPEPSFDVRRSRWAEVPRYGRRCHLQGFPIGGINVSWADQAVTVLGCVAGTE